jgi:hypothetical protein
MIAPGNFRNRFCDCSTTELIRVAADTGIEPVTHRVEVTRSLATGAVTNAIFGDQAARVGIGQASFSWTIGDSLSPCLCGWREVSRAFATEDVAAPGKNRARLIAVLSREDSVRSRTASPLGSPRSIRALRHWSCFCSTHGGTIAMRIGSCQDEGSASFTTRNGERKA